MLVFAMGEMPSVGNIARFLVRLALCYSIDTTLPRVHCKCYLWQSFKNLSKWKKKLTKFLPVYLWRNARLEDPSSKSSHWLKRRKPLAFEVIVALPLLLQSRRLFSSRLCRMMMTALKKNFARWCGEKTAENPENQVPIMPACRKWPN